MSDFLLEYSEGPRTAKISTVAKLDDMLDAASAEAVRLTRPSLPTLHDQKGRWLAIGVGDTMSVLSWHDDADPETGDLFSLGDVESTVEEVEFFYGNQYSFFPATAMIPNETARQAMRDFLQTGQRPSNVRWQKV